MRDRFFCTLVIAATLLSDCSSQLPKRHGIYRIISTAPLTQALQIVPYRTGMLFVAGIPQEARQALMTFHANGSVAEIPTGAWRSISGLAAAQDGTIWFTATAAPRRFVVARVDPQTHRVALTSVRAPAFGIVAGDDGSAWFTQPSSSQIGHINRTGSLQEYPVHAASSSHPGPWRITLGPDGATWFTLTFADAIGRLTSDGRLRIFHVPTANSRPAGIAVGPDRNIWFTELANTIGRVETNGHVTEFRSPALRDTPTAIVSGRNDDLWFCEIAALGRVTTRGAITTRPAPFGTCGGIASDTTGDVWFTQNIPAAGFSGPTRTALATYSPRDW